MLRTPGLKHLVPDHFPEDAFPTDYALKDISLALELAADVGVNAPAAQHTRDLLDGKPVTPQVLPHRLAFNLFCHNTAIGPDGKGRAEQKPQKHERKGRTVCEGGFGRGKRRAPDQGGQDERKTGHCR